MREDCLRSRVLPICPIFVMDLAIVRGAQSGSEVLFHAIVIYTYYVKLLAHYRFSFVGRTRRMLDKKSFVDLINSIPAKQKEIYGRGGGTDIFQRTAASWHLNAGCGDDFEDDLQAMIDA